MGRFEVNILRIVILYTNTVPTATIFSNATLATK